MEFHKLMKVQVKNNKNVVYHATKKPKESAKFRHWDNIPDRCSNAATGHRPYYAQVSAAK